MDVPRPWFGSCLQFGVRTSSGIFSSDRERFHVRFRLRPPAKRGRLLHSTHSGGANSPKHSPEIRPRIMSC